LPRTEDLTSHREAVATAVTRIAPDVAECSTWEAELLTYAQRPHRAPVLVRGDLPAATMGAHALAVDEQHLCQVADTVVAVSEYAADELAGAYGIARPAVISNAVDRDRFTPTGHTHPTSGWQIQLDRTGAVTDRRPLGDALTSDAAWASYFTPEPGLPRLIWVGKFTQMKGFDRLQRIAHALTGLARLLIVLGHGQVHYRVDLPAEVLLCQDLDPVDVPAVLRAADYLLSTSRWEGYGLAIAEALACGTPALLPAELAIAGELLAPGITGQLWTDEQHLLRILTERPPLTGRLRHRYSWRTNAARTLTAYHAMAPAGAIW
jgi:glycosyltransferase involved in cell wall biosynthesis